MFLGTSGWRRFMTSPDTMSEEDRQQVLQREIAKAVKDGWQVTTQTTTSATLTRKKKFSWIWFIIWLLLALVGGLVYLVYYATKKDESMMIQVGPTGKVTQTRS
jgi:uncharacterized membrane protein